MAAGNHDAPVLFAYDGSDHAKAAIRLAGRQLRRHRSAVVLTVFEPAAAQPFAPSPGPMPSEFDEGLELEAKRLASEGAELARANGFDAEPSAESGEPVWQIIIDSADQHDAAIVVMGSHGRTGFSRLLMGSIAEATARHTERPVLIVRS